MSGADQTLDASHTTLDRRLDVGLRLEREVRHRGHRRHRHLLLHGHDLGLDVVLHRRHAVAPGTPTDGAQVTSGESNWTITGTRAGSVEGLAFTGFDSITGAGSDTLTAPTAIGSSSVLGVSFTGFATTKVGAVDTLTWDAPVGDNTITIADDGTTNIGITYVNGGHSYLLDVLAPTSELVIDTGDGNNTVTLGALTLFAGQLTLIGGAGTNVLIGPQSPTTWRLLGPAAGSGGPASSTPVTWATTPSSIDAHVLTALSCASATECVAGDSAGNVVTSSDPAHTWSAPTAIDAGHAITGISCTATLCVAVDNAGRALTSSDLVTWTAVTIDGAIALTGVSCSGDDAVCVAIDGVGNVVTSTSPTSAWFVTNVGRDGCAHRYLLRLERALRRRRRRGPDRRVDEPDRRDADLDGDDDRSERRPRRRLVHDRRALRRDRHDRDGARVAGSGRRRHHVDGDGHRRGNHLRSDLMRRRPLRRR